MLKLLIYAKRKFNFQRFSNDVSTSFSGLNTLRFLGYFLVISWLFHHFSTVTSTVISTYLTSSLAIFPGERFRFTIQIFQGARPGPVRHSSFSRCTRPAGCPGLARPRCMLRTAIGAGSKARARTGRHLTFQGARPGRRGAGAAVAPAARVTRGRVAARSGGGSGRSPCPWQLRQWKTLSCTRRPQLPNTTGELA